MSATDGNTTDGNTTDGNTTPAASEYPYRLVDVHGQGWIHVGEGRFQPDYGFQRGLETMPYQWVVDERGPVRPVIPVPAADADAIVAALRAAGRKAVATTVHALLAVDRATADRPAPDSLMMAGREGSWESVRMVQITGEAFGISDKRVDPDAKATLVEVLTRWVTAEDYYVEVAENLAGLFARAAELAYRDAVTRCRTEIEQAATETQRRRALRELGVLLAPVGRWRVVADQHLMPGALGAVAAREIYYLLMSQAAFDSGIWDGTAEHPLLVDLRTRSIDREVIGDGDPAHHDRYREALYEAHVNRPFNDPTGERWITSIRHLYGHSHNRQRDGATMQPTYRRALVDLVAVLTGKPSADARAILDRHGEELSE